MSHSSVTQCLCRAMPSMSATNDSLLPKSSSTLRFTHRTSLLLSLRLLMVSFSNRPSMFVEGCTRFGLLRVVSSGISSDNHCVLQNIVLSGGSTMFQHFGQRLKRDLKQLVDQRLEARQVASGSTQKVRLDYRTEVQSAHILHAVVWRGSRSYLS